MGTIVHHMNIAVNRKVHAIHTTGHNKRTREPCAQDFSGTIGFYVKGLGSATEGLNDLFYVFLLVARKRLKCIVDRPYGG